MITRAHRSKARKADRVAVRPRVLTIDEIARLNDWPDPPCVPSLALRQCEQAATIEEVRAIVRRFLRPRGQDA